VLHCIATVARSQKSWSAILQRKLAKFKKILHFCYSVFYLLK
jgi:hypothetical protein